MNVACAGGEPLALTDCLNFGNPEKPEIGWELAQAIEGIVTRGRVTRHPRRLGERLALQRDRRGADPADAGRRLRRPRPRRDADPRPLASRRQRLPAARHSATGSSRSSGENAHRFSLAHDVSDGGLELALREAAAWSGRDVVPTSSTRVGKASSSSPPARGPPGTTSSSWGGAPDVRRLRRPRAGRDVARLTYFGLYALQHRGQESAGIAVCEDGRLTAVRDLGLVPQVFDERSLSALRGEFAIGHTRYSTTGGNAWANAQPLLHHGRVRTVALGHNGNLVNAEALARRASASRSRRAPTPR